MLQKISFQNTLKFIVINILGTIFYASGITCFTKPHYIAPGGASGIAVLVNFVTNFPIGVFILLFNIPLLFIAKNFLSKEFVIKTLFSTVLLFMVTDYVVIYFPIYKGDALLASMFGGALMGIGLALVHIGGSNTGGISLLGIIIQRRYPQFQVGKLLYLLNLSVVLVSGIVFNNIESMLYAIVAIYISGAFMDNMISSISASNLLIVISEYTENIREIILKERNGITILKGEGGYSSKEKQVILCASTKSDCEHMQKAIRQVDEQAMMIVTDAKRVSNKSFKHIV